MIYHCVNCDKEIPEEKLMEDYFGDGDFITHTYVCPNCGSELFNEEGKATLDYYLIKFGWNENHDSG